jgi:Na+/proline symporter
MRILGLHPLDVTIIIACLMATIIMGWWVSRGVKKGTDFLAAGKKMGGWLQFFLNFGTMTDASSGATVAAEVYRQGAGGAWINFQLLFATPFYWFTSVWFRRSRQITFADLFTDRFGGKKLAMFFAIMNLGINFVLMGMGNIVSYKVASAMIVKPESAYTVAERASVDGYKEYQSLQVKTGAGKLLAEEGRRFQVLDSMKKHGELRSYISYLKPVPFYLGYIVVVAIYIMLGGIKAAAIIDAFQGLLLIIFSVMMIPMGLEKVGGFRGLHERVPGYKFEIFGSLAASEYTWYTILAIRLLRAMNAWRDAESSEAVLENG